MKCPWQRLFFPYHHENKTETPHLVSWPSFSNFMHSHTLLETLVLGLPSPLTILLDISGRFVFKFSFILNLHNPKLQIRQSLNWTNWVKRKQEILPAPKMVLLLTTSANSVLPALGLFQFQSMNCSSFEESKCVSWTP